MTTPEEPVKMMLTKYETSKIFEGMCPKCPTTAQGELLDASGDGSMLECSRCGNYFVVDYLDEGMN